MGKVLLLNPRLPQPTTGMNIPISLLYLGTWLRQQGVDITILDACNHDDNDFESILEEHITGTTVVGLSVMTAQIASAIRLTQTVRRYNPNVRVVWGGVHPTLYPEQVLHSGYADSVVKGEGENAMLRLLGGATGIVEDKTPFDINLLGTPDYSLLDDISKSGGIASVGNRITAGVPIMTSRGCPHRCTFCINSVIKLKYRFRSADLVLADIENAVRQGAAHICFADEDFFANKRRLIEILDGIADKGLEFKWFGTARADYFRETHINQDLITRIKRSGCQQLGIGIESGSQRLLDKIKKDITVADSIRAAQLLSRAGIDISLSFMDGLPTESPEETLQTLDLAVKTVGMSNRFRILGPQIYRPYAGSKLYDECLELGMQEPHSLTDWVDSPYIGIDIESKDYHLFPWVQYPMRELTRLNFYAWMSGLRIRWSPVTRAIRKLGAWRCRHRWFMFPIEIWAVRMSRRYNLAQRVSIGKFK